MGWWEQGTLLARIKRKRKEKRNQSFVNFVGCCNGERQGSCTSGQPLFSRSLGLCRWHNVPRISERREAGLSSTVHRWPTGGKRSDTASLPLWSLGGFTRECFKCVILYNVPQSNNCFEIVKLSLR